MKHPVCIPNLSNKTQVRLKKINEREGFDKALIVLSPISAGVSIASFTSAIATPLGLASTIFKFVFSITTGILKSY